MAPAETATVAPLVVVRLTARLFYHARPLPTRNLQIQNPKCEMGSVKSAKESLFLALSVMELPIFVRRNLEVGQRWE